MIKRVAEKTEKTTRQLFGVECLRVEYSRVLEYSQQPYSSTKFTSVSIIYGV